MAPARGCSARPSGTRYWQLATAAALRTGHRHYGMPRSRWPRVRRRSAGDPPLAGVSRIFILKKTFYSGAERIRAAAEENSALPRFILAECPGYAAGHRGRKNVHCVGKTDNALALSAEQTGEREISGPNSRLRQRPYRARRGRSAYCRPASSPSSNSVVARPYPVLAQAWGQVAVVAVPRARRRARPLRSTHRWRSTGRSAYSPGALVEHHRPEGEAFGDGAVRRYVAQIKWSHRAVQYWHRSSSSAGRFETLKTTEGGIEERQGDVLAGGSLAQQFQAPR